MSAGRQGRDVPGPQGGHWEVDTELTARQIHDTHLRRFRRPGVWLSRAPDTHLLITTRCPPLLGISRGSPYPPIKQHPGHQKHTLESIQKLPPAVQEAGDNLEWGRSGMRSFQGAWRHCPLPQSTDVLSQLVREQGSHKTQGAGEGTRKAAQ